MICIYGIKNTQTGKIYIGSTNNMTRRFKRHKTELRNGKHSNQYLQRAWNKVGEDNIDFIILATCGEHQLLKKEIEYIKKYNSLDSTFGYNLVVPLNVATRKISKEHSRKLSEAMKGKLPSNFEEMRRKTWKSVDYYEGKKFIKNYPSVRKLALHLEIDAQNIHNYLSGKTKFLRKYPTWHFEYKKETL